MHSTITKRVWSMILALAMILSTFTVGFTFGASAAEPQKGSATVTDGEIVAENYDLSDAEKKLISSGYLIGSTYNYYVPDANDDLIEVDIDTMTVTADTYEGTTGFIWKPVSADIVVSEQVKETIYFNGNTATYTYDGAAFSVKVKYEMSLSVDTDTQTELLNAPAYLKQAVEVMDTIVSVRENLSALELDQAVDVFKLLNSEGIEVPLGQGTVELAFEGETKVAATALIAQMDANSGNRLNISVIADEYAAAESKIEYIIANADTIKGEIASAHDCIETLTQPYGVLDMAARFSGMSAVASVYNSLTIAKSSLASINSADAFKLADHKDIVKSDLTTAQYEALDALTFALAGETLKGGDAAVKNPLVADTTTIQFNMAMFDVTVKVVLNLTGSDNTVGKYDEKSRVITLAEGATKDQIQDAITGSGFVNATLTGWGSKYVAGKFTPVSTELPATLTQDVEYVVTYSPNLYEVNYLGNATQYPYGYQLKLEPHSDPAKAYDYYVNGNYAAQGSTYVVTGETVITRAEGKAYTNYTVNGLVADIYFADNDKAQDILNSGALNIGNDIIAVRVPDNSKGIVTLSENTTLVANKYASSYEDLNWVPYSYTVVGATETSYLFNGQTAVTITETDFDRVDVYYRLTLSNLDDAYVLDVAQLPNTLVEEAEEQSKILNTFANNTGAMEQVTKPILSAIKGVVSEDATIDATTKAKMLETIDGISANCFDTDGNLKIYNMMEQYKDANNGGLRYYYLNSSSIIKEINVLAGYLNTLLSADLRVALINLINTQLPQYADKVDQLDDLKSKVDAAAQIAPPNANINLTDATALGKLTDALASAGDVAQITSVEDLYLDSAAIVVNADNKVTISVTVAKNNGTPVSIPSHTYTKGDILKQSDVDTIVAEINAAIATLGVNDKYYTTDYVESTMQALVGQDVSKIENTYAFTWTPKTFTVSVEGVAVDQTVSVDNLEISLPAGPAGIRYEYVIGGSNVKAGTYKFSLSQIDTLFANGTYHIEREEFDVSEEDLTAFVNDLNKAIGNDAIVFALTKDSAGKYAIVMKINAASTSELPAAVKGMAMELAQSYTYIAFEDQAVVYDDNGTEVSVQAIINTIMNSSFGTEALKKLVDANGNIQNIALPGTVISDKKMTVAGGKLAETSLVLGSSAAVVDYNVPMYITLGSAPSYLTQLRNLMANQLAPYFELTCANGKINIGLNLPKKAYEAYLAVLLASDYADIANVNSINEDVAVGFMMDVIHPLMQSDASASSIQNTLAKFGYNIDLSGYDKAVEAIRKMYNMTTFTYNAVDSTYDADANVGIKSFINSMNLGSFAGMIAESDTGLNFSVAINLDNLDKNYEALYFDIGAAGITNKFGLVEDVAAKVGEIAGTAIVILLSDVNADLTFNTTTVLNLNGYTVNGDVAANTSLRIVDTIIDTNVVGSVTGTISGNVKIAGGQYNADVSAFLTEGFEQDANGVVENVFFNLVKDTNGDISVELNAGMLATNKVPDVATLAVDIVAEILANGFTANKLYVDGNKVYEITVDDLIGIYTGSDRVNTVINKIMDMIDINSLKTLSNSILADVSDFDSLYASMLVDIANGTETPILSYQITTGAWGISVDYVQSDDSITASIVSNGTNSKALNIVIVGDDADKQHLANLLGMLAETTSADVSIDEATYSRNDKNFIFNLGVSGDVQVDFSNDPKYAIMFNVLIADGIGASANTELVAGLKMYFETGSMQALEAAFNKITVAQVVTAIENIHRGDKFEDMLKNLGLDGYNAADAIAAEAEIDAFAKLLGILSRRLNINGTSTQFGSFVDDVTGAYTIDKSNIVRTVSPSLGGYTFTFNAKIVDLFASMKLFGEPSSVDYSELQAAIIYAEGLDESKYSEGSWMNLEDALADAIDALNSKDQAVVDAAKDALWDAINALDEMEQYWSALRDVINSVPTDSSLYTPESWADLETALTAAMAALSSRIPSVVNAAAADLQAAIDALELATTVDYSELLALLQYVDGLDYETTPYTFDSWSNLRAVYNDAKAVLSSTDQAVIDAAVEDLRNAINALEYMNYSELETQIGIAESLDEVMYLASSWAKLQTALQAAKSALSSRDQDYVDDMAAALANAIENLVKKPAEEEGVDYTALVELLNKAIKLVESDYTAESWAPFQTALDAGMAALSSKYQSVVDAAVAALQTAMNNLVKKPGAVDYSELAALIAQAEKLVEGDYTADSWKNFQTVLAAAKTALTATNQVAVDTAVKALKDAIDALVKMNYSDLLAQIEAAEKLDKDEYTSASWKVLEDALAAAKAALTSRDQAEVDAAAKALKDAIDALVKMDYSELNAQIEAAEKLNEDEYTSASWKVLEDALAAAKDALTSKDQAVVDAAAKALKDAIAALVKMDYSELNAQIEAAEALTEAEYTTDSWTALAEALAAAKDALTSKDQAVVDAAAKALKDAIAALVKVDYSELNAQISAAEAMTEAEYTADSWTALAEALAAAKDALTSRDQAVVDAAAAALKTAIGAAVKLDYSELKAQISAAEALTEAEYSADSWTALQTALTAAKAALTARDQATIDAAAAALKSAIESAVKLDYSELKAQIEAAEALVEEDYTEESWKALQDALAAAKEALTARDQATIDAAAAALKAAIESMEESAVIWPWIVFPIIILVIAGGIVAFLVVKKKKKEDDNTPLVDYDPADDN